MFGAHRRKSLMLQSDVWLFSVRKVMPLILHRDMTGLLGRISSRGGYAVRRRRRTISDANLN